MCLVLGTPAPKQKGGFLFGFPVKIQKQGAQKENTPPYALILFQSTLDLWMRPQESGQLVSALSCLFLGVGPPKMASVFLLVSIYNHNHKVYPQKSNVQIRGVLFATFCEKMGEPLKKESFTSSSTRNPSLQGSRSFFHQSWRKDALPLVQIDPRILPTEVPQLLLPLSAPGTAIAPAPGFRDFRVQSLTPQLTSPSPLEFFWVPGVSMTL